MYIIADLTRATVGSIQSVLDRLPKSDAGSESFILEIVIQQNQREELPGSHQQFIITEVDSSKDVGAQVVDILKLRARENVTENFVALSFSSYVLGAIHKIDATTKDRVTFLPWGQARMLRDATGRLTISSLDPDAWPLASISEESTFAALISVLEEAKALDPATGLRQTALRPRLSIKDARLSSKRTGQVKNFISRLVQRSARKGLVSVDNSDATNPLLWLAAGAPQPMGQQKAGVTKQPSGSSYIKTLKEGKMGPFPNFREDVFSEFENLVASQEDKLSLEQLIGRSISAVKERSNGDHVGFSWTCVKEFITELLRLHPVVMDENQQIFRPGFSTWKTKVFSLTEQWQLKLDGELIMFLLREGCEISFHDMSELTGAIYKTREDSYMSRLFDVITLLKNSGKIVFDEADSIIRLTPA